LIIAFLFTRLAFAQSYSPYFFNDSLQDEGITTEEQYHNLKKIL